MDGSDFVVGEAHAPQPLLLQRDGGFVFALGGVVLRRLHFSAFGLQKSWGRRPNQHCAGNDTSLLHISNSITGDTFCIFMAVFYFLSLRKTKLYYLFLKNFNLIISLFIKR